MGAAVMAEAAHDRPLRHAGGRRARRQCGDPASGPRREAAHEPGCRRATGAEVRSTPSPRARRPRRAVNYDDSEPDEDEEDLELGPPDADDGWD